MNAHLANYLPWPTLLLLAVSVLIPALTTAISKEKWDTSLIGIATVTVSIAGGFLTELAHAQGRFDWKAAAVASLGSWAVAVVAQARIYAGTRLEDWLRRLGDKSFAAKFVSDVESDLDPSGSGAVVDAGDVRDLLEPAAPAVEPAAPTV